MKQVCKKCGADWAANAIDGQCRICGSRFAGHKTPAKPGAPAVSPEANVNSGSGSNRSHGQSDNTDSSYSLKKHLKNLILPALILVFIILGPSLDQKDKRQFDIFIAPVVKPVKKYILDPIENIIRKTFDILLAPADFIRTLDGEKVREILSSSGLSGGYNQSNLHSIQTGIGWSSLDSKLLSEDLDNFSLSRQYSWGLKIARLWSQDAQLTGFMIRKLHSSEISGNAAVNLADGKSSKIEIDWTFTSPSRLKAFNELSLTTDKNLPATSLWIKYSSGEFRVMASSFNYKIKTGVSTPENLPCTFAGVYNTAKIKSGLKPSLYYDLDLRDIQIRKGKWRIGVKGHSGGVYIYLDECTM